MNFTVTFLRRRPEALGFIFLRKESRLFAVPTSRSADHEYLDPDEWQSMNALLLLNRRVLAELDRDLRQGHGLSVTAFDFLVPLPTPPDPRRRMSSLGEKGILTPAGVTHRATRLERDVLVRREVDPS